MGFFDQFRDPTVDGGFIPAPAPSSTPGQATTGQGLNPNGPTGAPGTPGPTATPAQWAAWLQANGYGGPPGSGTTGITNNGAPPGTGSQLSFAPYPYAFNPSQPGGGSLPGASGGSGGVPPVPTGNPMDAATIRQWLSQFASGDPSVQNDPGYWVGVIQQHGGLTADNAGYFGGRILQGPGGASGSGGYQAGSYTPLAPFTGAPQSSFGTYTAPSYNGNTQIQAAPAFSYGGPSLQTPSLYQAGTIRTPQAFGGIGGPNGATSPQAPPSYAPWQGQNAPYGQAPTTPAAASSSAPGTSTAAASAAPPPVDPSAGAQAAGYSPGWVHTAEGNWVPPDHPLAQAAVQQYQTALAAYTAQQAAAPAGSTDATAATATNGPTPATAGGPIRDGGPQAPTAPGSSSPYGYQLSGLPPGQTPQQDATGQAPVASATPLTPGQLDAGALTLPTYAAPAAYQAPAPYVAPTYTAPSPYVLPTGQAALDADPGYDFRIKQGLGAIQNSAASHGTLLTGGTEKALSDYNQAAASQEYGNYVGQTQSTYGLNAQTGLNAFNANATTGQNAYNANAQTGLNAYLGNASTSLNSYLGNAQTQLGAQGQAFGQAAQTYQINAGLQNQIAQQNQANNLAAYNTNASTQQGYQAQQYGQAANTWGMNQSNSNQAQQQSIGNALSAYSTQGQLGQSAAALNSQNAQNAWSNNYQSAWNAYQSSVQQAENAAGLGLSYSQLGLQANNQQFNQAATTYGINQGVYNQGQTNQYNWQNGLAQLGLTAAGDAGGSGAGAANAIGGLGTSGANATAAQIIAGATTYNQLFQGLSQIGLGAYAQYIWGTNHPGQTPTYGYGSN